jgi:hypothetical protein
MYHGILAGLALVFALTFAACPTGGGPGGDPQQTPGPSQADLNPNTTVPQKAAEIPDFDTATGGTYVADETTATALVTAAMDEVQDIIGGLGINFSAAAASKTDGARGVIKNEKIEYYFSEHQADIDKEIPGAKVYGYAKGTVSYDDPDVLPVRVNVDAKYRAEIPDGYTSSGTYTIKAVVGGEAKATNLYISENPSGTVKVTGTANVKFEVALSVTDGSNWVKCIVTESANLASSGRIKLTYSAKIFHTKDSSTYWATAEAGADLDINDLLGGFSDNSAEPAPAPPPAPKG